MKLTCVLYFIGKEKYSDLCALQEVDCANWKQFRGIIS